jgi:hypothetical protein
MSEFAPKGKKDIKAEIGMLEDYIEKLEEDIRKFSGDHEYESEIEHIERDLEVLRNRLLLLEILLMLSSEN